MDTISKLLTIVGVCLAGAIPVFICLHVFVPPIVRKIGEKHFADMNGLDGCSITVYCGFAMLAAPIVSSVWDISIFIWIGILCALGVIYSILWLWIAGRGGRRFEWEFRGEKIYRLSDDQLLQPTFIKQDSDFFQTDAFRSYSFYYLELHDKNGLLARNSYLSGEEYAAAYWQVLKTQENIPCRGLALTIIWRETPTNWLTYHFSQDWAEILCDSLELLPEESREWWRQWLHPAFPRDGIALVEKESVAFYWNELATAYRERIAAKEMLVQENSVILLEQFLERAAGPFEFVSGNRIEMLAEEVAPTGAALMYFSEDPLRLEIQPHK